MLVTFILLKYEIRKGTVLVEGVELLLFEGRDSNVIVKLILQEGH